MLPRTVLLLVRKIVLGGLLLFSWASQVQAFELLVKISKPDGSPAPGIAIQRVLLVHQDMDNEVAGKTDEKGELRVPFEGMMTKADGTGDGEYRFLAMPDDYRWEMSPKYIWTYPPQTYAAATSESRGYFDDSQRNAAPSVDNSGIGETIWATPDVSNIWNVTLQRGEDVTVAVKDQSGDPVPNVVFEMEVDLCAPTHTGFGGEVGLPQVRTDEHGCFVLRHTGDFFYKFAPCTERYCSPTMDWWNVSVLARFAGKEGRLIFHKCTPKRLFVRVVDKNTRMPVEGATLVPTDKGGDGILQPNIGTTDKDGVFKTDKFLYSDIAAAIAICKYENHDSSPSVATYDSSSIDMNGFDPAKDYVVELAPKKD